jgi:GT2 family glycosyltransferase
MNTTFHRECLPSKTTDADIENDVDLSICLVNWNTCDLLRDCINSILRHSVRLKIEIFVIDNASSDNSVDMINNEFPNIVLISNTENTGFAYANNQGIALSTGRNILLINPDTLVLPNALENMVAFLDKSPTVGAVAAKLYNADMSLQYSVRRFPTYLTPFTENPDLGEIPFMRKYTDKSRMMEWNHDSIREVDQPAGAALMIKRAVIETLGKLDKQYHMFFEDVDICYRIKKNGWQIYYLPDAEIIHYGGQSVRQRVNVGEEFYRSLILYFKTRYGKRGERRIRMYMIVGSVFYIFYAFTRYLFKLHTAFNVAKTSLMVFRCGFLSHDDTAAYSG